MYHALYLVVDDNAHNHSDQCDQDDGNSSLECIQYNIQDAMRHDDTTLAIPTIVGELEENTTPLFAFTLFVRLLTCYGQPLGRYRGDGGEGVFTIVVVVVAR